MKDVLRQLGSFSCSQIARPCFWFSWSIHKDYTEKSEYVLLVWV